MFVLVKIILRFDLITRIPPENILKEFRDILYVDGCDERSVKRGQ